MWSASVELSGRGVWVADLPIAWNGRGEPAFLSYVLDLQQDSGDTLQPTIFAYSIFLDVDGTGLMGGPNRTGFQQNIGGVLPKATLADAVLAVGGEPIIDTRTTGGTGTRVVGQGHPVPVQGHPRLGIAFGYDFGDQQASLTASANLTGSARFIAPNVTTSDKAGFISTLHAETSGCTMVAFTWACAADQDFAFMTKNNSFVWWRASGIGSASMLLRDDGAVVNECDTVRDDELPWEGAVLWWEGFAWDGHMQIAGTNALVGPPVVLLFWADMPSILVLGPPAC